MNTRLQLYQGTPADLMAVQKWAIQRMIELMRPFGIAGITSDWTPVGVSGVLDVNFTPTERTPPGSFGTLQPRVVRWLAEGMQLFGVMTIETAPTEAELNELHRMWEIASNFKPQEAQQSTVKTPPTTDPTNRSAV